MAYVEFYPLYGILSGSTVTYVGPMSPVMQRNLTPALQKGEKLVELDVSDVSYSKICEIAYANGNLSPWMRSNRSHPLKFYSNCLRNFADFWMILGVEI